MLERFQWSLHWALPRRVTGSRGDVRRTPRLDMLQYPFRVPVIRVRQYRRAKRDVAGGDKHAVAQNTRAGYCGNAVPEPGLREHAEQERHENVEILPMFLSSV
jgi:hypothetical protein